MTETATVTLHIGVNQDGEFWIGNDECDNAEEVSDNLSGVTKVYTITLNVPLPKVAQLAATLTDTEGETILTIS